MVQWFGTIGNGVADDTFAVQNALNTATRVIFSAGFTFLISGCQVPSNTHMVFEIGCVVKLANNSNRPAFQNVNFQKSGWGANTYGLDSNITVEGLYLDGNQANQAHTGSGIYASEFTSGIRFFGVTNLVLKDVTIHYARTFSIWVCSIYNLTAHNIRFDQYMGGTPDNQDGLHVNGPAENLDIRNVRGSTNDDMIALNADDGYLGANFTTGPISNAVIEGVYPVACLNGVRLLSATSRMDQITIRSVKGSTRDVAVNQSPFGLGVGNVGSLTIDDIDVRCSNPYQPTTSDYYSVITLDGRIDNVSISQVKNNRPADNRPTVRVAGTSNIGVMTVDGLSVLEVNTSTLTGIKPISVYGLIDTLTLREINYFRDSTLLQTGNILYINAPGHGIKNLTCSDWVVEGTVAPISLNDGTLDNVTLTNIQDVGGLSGYPLVALSSISGSLTNLSIRDCFTDPGRMFITVGGLSVLGSRTTIDNAGASGASASLPSNQSCAAAAYTKLNFATAVFDRIGEYSTANQQFTVLQGVGVYLVSCSVDVTVPTNPTIFGLALYKNGGLYRVLSSGSAISDIAIVGTALVGVAQNDVLDIRLYCNNATTAKSDANTVVFYERIK